MSQQAKTEAAPDGALHALARATKAARARLGCTAMPSAGGRPVSTVARNGSICIGYSFAESRTTWGFEQIAGPMSIGEAIAHLDAMQ